MNNHTTKVQPVLNLDRNEYLLAPGLELTEVRKLVQTVTQQKVSQKSILNRAKTDRFDVPYENGILIFDSSNRGKLLWDAYCCPVAIAPKSA